MYLVIDVGSNTIRAVVFRIEEGKLIPILNKKYSAGLAGYIQTDGSMSRDGIELCIEILSEIRIIIDSFDFDGVYPFATASLRNISNSAEVLCEISKRCGLSIQLLTGKEEAFFDYYGAAQEMSQGKGVLIDIGGGSTEIVIYDDKKPLATESIHIGSLNLYHKYVSSLIPTAEEIREIGAETKRQLKNLDLKMGQEKETGTMLCAVGGTARAALKLYNSIYRLKENTVYERCFLKNLLFTKRDEGQLMNLILKTAPERIHTLLPGIAVLYYAAKYFDRKRIITSSHGVREGYLYYLLEKEGVLHG